jgi:hypothetical protein
MVWRAVKKPLLTAAVLILVQAGLGGMVVKLDLAAAVLAIHLGTAYVIFAILFWQALKLSRWGDPLRTGHEKAQRFGKEAIVATLVQVVSGGLVAGTGAGLLMNTWPKVGDHWIPPMSVMWGDWYSPVWANIWQNQILIQFFHRWWAFCRRGSCDSFGDSRDEGAALYSRKSGAARSGDRAGVADSARHRNSFDEGAAAHGAHSSRSRASAILALDYHHARNGLFARCFHFAERGLRT